MKTAEIKLSNLISMDQATEQIENMVMNENIIIDEGFYLEIYINPDGVYCDEDEECSSNGYSLFRHINKSISFGDFLELELFNEGSLKDSTMTINIIPNKDPLYEEDRSMCTNLL